MPLRDHLRELRTRVLLAAAGLAVGATLGWFTYDSLIERVQAPLVRIAAEREGLVALNYEGLATALDMQIKIDVSPADPYSVLSQQTSLDNALGGGHITFEEWVSALDANSPVPAAKFRKILEERKAAQQAMAMQAGAGAGMPAGQAPAMGGIPAQAAMTGGAANAVQNMPV